MEYLADRTLNLKNDVNGQMQAMDRYPCTLMTFLFGVDDHVSSSL